MAKVFCVLEEVWRVAANVGVAEWLQANFKLCRARRALRIANFVSLHKLTDFGTAGFDGSRAARIAQALVADAGCTVIYRQSPAQRPILCADLGLLGHRNRAGDAPGDRRGDLEDRLAVDLLRFAP